MIRRWNILADVGTTLDSVAPLTLIQAPRGYGKSVFTDQWLGQLDAPVEQVIRVTATRGLAPDSFWNDVVLTQASEVAARESDGSVNWASWLNGLRVPTLVLVEDYEKATSAILDRSIVKAVESQVFLHVMVVARHTVLLDGPLAAASVGVKRLTSADLEFSDEELERAFNLIDCDDRREALEQIRPAIRWPRAWDKAVRVASSASLGDVQDAIAVALNSLGDTSSLVVHEDSTGARALPLENAILVVTRNVEDADQTALAMALEESPENTELAVGRLLALGEIERLVGPGGLRLSVPKAMRSVLQTVKRTDQEERETRRLLTLYADSVLDSDPAEALRVYFLLGRRERLTPTVIRYFGDGLDLGPIAGELEAMSPQELEGNPGFLAMRTVLDRADPLVPMESVQETASTLIRVLNQAANSDEAAEQADDALDGWQAVEAAVRTVALRTVGQYDEALRLARQQERSLAEHMRSDFWEGGSGLPFAYAIFALTGILCGDFALARRFATRSLSEATVLGAAGALTRAHCQLAVIEALEFDAGEALRNLRAAKRTSMAVGKSIAPDVRVNYDLAVALARAQIGDLEEAKRALDRLLPTAHRREQWPYIVLAESYVLQRTRGARVALDGLQERLSDPRRPPISDYAEALLRARLAIVALHDGSLIVAEEALAGTDQRISQIVAAHIRLALFRNQYHRAQVLADAARRVMPQELLPPDLIVAAALAEYGTGDAEGSAALLRGVSSRLRDEGASVFLMSFPFDLLRDAVRSAKELGDVDLLDVVEAVPHGDRAFAFPPLSSAELAVFQGLAAGKTLSQVAEELLVSQNTAKSHRRNIYRKLRVSTLSAALERATRLGLLAPDSSSAEQEAS